MKLSDYLSDYYHYLIGKLKRKEEELPEGEYYNGYHERMKNETETIERNGKELIASKTRLTWYEDSWLALERNTYEYDHQGQQIRHTLYENRGGKMIRVFEETPEKKTYFDRFGRVIRDPIKWMPSNIGRWLRLEARRPESRRPEWGKKFQKWANALATLKGETNVSLPEQVEKKDTQKKIGFWGSFRQKVEKAYTSVVSDNMRHRFRRKRTIKLEHKGKYRKFRVFARTAWINTADYEDGYLRHSGWVNLNDYKDGHFQNNDDHLAKWELLVFPGETRWHWDSKTGQYGCIKAEKEYRLNRYYSVPTSRLYCYRTYKKRPGSLQGDPETETYFGEFLDDGTPDIKFLEGENEDSSCYTNRTVTRQRRYSRNADDILCCEEDKFNARDDRNTCLSERSHSTCENGVWTVQDKEVYIYGSFSEPLGSEYDVMHTPPYLKAKIRYERRGKKLVMVQKTTYTNFDQEHYIPLQKKSGHYEADHGPQCGCYREPRETRYYDDEGRLEKSQIYTRELTKLSEIPLLFCDETSYTYSEGKQQVSVPKTTFSVDGKVWGTMDELERLIQQRTRMQKMQKKQKELLTEHSALRDQTDSKPAEPKKAEPVKPKGEKAISDRMHQARAENPRT